MPVLLFKTNTERQFSILDCRFAIEENLARDNRQSQIANRKFLFLFVFASLVLCVNLFGADNGQNRKVADAMALSGVAAQGLGNIEKAKDLFYKALANDENCPEALYELGKIFEKENKPVAAGDFFVRASRQMAQEEKSNPVFVSKRADADRRLKSLNPFAPRFALTLEDYAQELERIARKTPDTLTREEALNRVESLKLAELLPPGKMPKIEPVAKAPPKRTGQEDDSADSPRSARNRSKPEETETVVPPAVETALKKAGWTTILGKWTRKAEGVYEVTNGVLEAQKTDGVIDVTVHKGAGVVKIFVRNSHKDYADFEFGDLLAAFASGYGMAVKNSSCKIFTPTSASYFSNNNSFEPYLEREDPLPAEYPKNQFMMSVQDTKLTYTINGKIIRNANYKISRDGPFVIEIHGTATIENPRNMGQ